MATLGPQVTIRSLSDDYCEFVLAGVDVAFANALVDEAGIAIVPGAAFGDYSRFFRLSLAGDDASLESALRKIVEVAERAH